MSYFHGLAYVAHFYHAAGTHMLSVVMPSILCLPYCHNNNCDHSHILWTTEGIIYNDLINAVYSLQINCVLIINIPLFMVVSLFTFLMVYLLLSVIEIAQHQVIGWLVSKELERMWKEEVFALFVRCNCSRSMEGITGWNPKRMSEWLVSRWRWDCQIYWTQSRCSSNSDGFGCFEYKRVL
jgi:hypothetical protein